MACKLHSRPDLTCPQCRESLPRTGEGRVLPDLKQLPGLPINRQPRTAVSTKPAVPAARSPCRFEGAVLEFCTRCGSAGELNHVRDCEVHDRCTRGPNSTGTASCSNCPDFAPPLLQLGLAGDHSGAGVVLGCYGLPQLTAIQVATIRRCCGPVPILIADDGSGRDSEFEAIAAATEGVEFWPSEHRLGHYAGDLSVFSKGLQWAQNRGLKWMCKLSQRFLWTEPGWLAEAVSEAEASGHQTLMQRCLDSAKGKPVDLKVRSESMLLRVPDWVPFLPEMEKQRLGNPTEYFIWHLIHRDFGGHYGEWKRLPVNRYAAAAGSIWHGSHSRRHFEQWAAELGLPLDPEFYTEGHQGKPGWVRG